MFNSPNRIFDKTKSKRSETVKQVKGFQNLSKIPCPTHQKTQREKCFISMKFQHHDLCGLKDDESIITGDPLHISMQAGSSI